MNSKISRLPTNIPEQLNTRLGHGEKRSAILTWLNSLPDCFNTF